MRTHKYATQAEFEAAAIVQYAKVQSLYEELGKAIRLHPDTQTTGRLRSSFRAAKTQLDEILEREPDD